MKGISFVVLFKDDPEKDLFFSFTKGVTDVRVEGTSVIVTGEGVDTEKVFPEGINCLDPAEETVIIDIKDSPVTTDAVPRHLKQLILVDYGNDEQYDFILLPWWVIERYAPEPGDEMDYVIRIKGPTGVSGGHIITEYFSVDRIRTSNNKKNLNHE